MRLLLLLLPIAAFIPNSIRIASATVYTVQYALDGTMEM